MGDFYGGIPKDLVLSFKEKYGLRGFVETGTFHGETTLWAVKYFERVYTVELSPQLWREVSQKLTPFKNVNCILGSSRNLMAPLAILPALQVPTLFWLDAHWGGSGLDKYDPSGGCPLREEILAINQFRSQQRDVIIVDDYRLFPDDEGKDWPSKNWVVRELLNDLQRTVTVENDIFIAEPRTL